MKTTETKNTHMYELQEKRSEAKGREEKNAQICALANERDHAGSQKTG